MTSTTLAMTRRGLLGGASAALLATPLVVRAGQDPWATSSWRKLSDSDWHARLPQGSYEVLRKEATEAPFSNPLNNEHRAGVFACRGCGLPLFKSQWKYDSGTGWPSFWTAIPDALGKKSDFAIGYLRTEYHCARCLGHQGHVFDDGPKPTGLRYCNNGLALSFAAT